MVGALGLTLIEEPVPTCVPPHRPLYQAHCPLVPNEPPLRVSALLWPALMVGGLADADEGAVGGVVQPITFTVTVTDAQDVF